MIDAIGASFLSTILQANNSLFLNPTRQVKPTEKTTEPTKVNNINTDATGLYITSEARQVLVALKQVNASKQIGEKTRDCAPVFSSLLTKTQAYPTYTASGEAALTNTTQNFAFFSNSNASEITAEKASAIYRSIGGETSLAPWGTGISLTI